MIGIGIACAVASANYFVAASAHFRHVHKTDEMIVAQIRELLTVHFENLPESDEIFVRYGRFQEFVDWKWRRPQYAWQLVERIDVTTIAKFEKADVRVGLGVSRGGAAKIVRLKMTPDQSWESRDDTALEIENGEFWLIREGGYRSRSTIDGWAKHPDFIYE